VTVQNSAPAFTTNFGNRSDDEGATVSLDADATDADGDSLTYSATGLPTGLTINASSGVISGTIAAGQATVVNSWGSAPTGGAYTLQGTAANYDVTGSVGTIQLGSPGTNRSAALAGVSVRDVDVSFRVATDKATTGGAQYVYAVARRIDASNEYRAQVRFAPGGGVFLLANSLVGNAATNIGTEVQVAGLTRSPGSFIWVRAQFSGASPTTIRMRAWADGSPEPSTWQFTATNSVAGLQVAGGVGVRAYLGSATSNAPVLVSFDDFLAASIAAP
jgi:hypothetical protein